MYGLFHHVLVYMGHLYLVVFTLNLYFLDANILIMVQQVRLMMFLSSSGPIVNVKSKLGPEIGSVMAWPTHHHPPTTTHPPDNFFLAVNC